MPCWGMVQMYHSLHIHVPVGGHLGCFQALAILDKVDLRSPFLEAHAPGRA